MYFASEFVQAGGLMSYSGNNDLQYKRAATYVDKILKGAKPADLPLEAPTKFDLVINLRAAKQIGLTFHPMCSQERIELYDDSEQQAVSSWQQKRRRNEKRVTKELSVYLRALRLSAWVFQQRRSSRRKSLG